MTMTADEQKLLHSHIDHAKNYLEFGSGESTIYAAEAKSLNAIDSVESSESFIDENLRPNAAIAEALAAGKLTFHIIDIGKTGSWGYPKDKSKKHLWPNYSLSVFSQESTHDLVLVDGRFRVACALNSILNTPDACRIMIHDFWKRRQYHFLLKYLDLEDGADMLAVFKKKKEINRSKLQSIIRRYQYRPDDMTALFRLRLRIRNRLRI